MKEKIIKFGNLLLIGIIAFVLGFGNLKAASAYISVKSSASNVIVGRTFNVTVTISSSVALGSWEYTIDYNSSLFKLTSGQSYIADYGNGSKKVASYSYTFKAIASGTGRIGVRSYGAYDWSEARMSVTSGSATIKTMTQAELEASYSKNNNLSSLSVEGYTLSSAFNKDTLEYVVELPSNVESINVIATKEDSRSSISGAGIVAVSEGENRIPIVVTAENGSVKTYIVVAKVSDPNPITVTTIDKKEMTVVKRESLLTIPETFTKTTTKINDIDVPAFYSEITKYTLVGLKDKDGKVGLYVYNKSENSYTPYNVITFNQIKLFPLSTNVDGKFKNYIFTKAKINETEVSAYKIKDASEYSVIYAVNIETGKKDYYIHDSKTNTVIRYTSEEADILNKKLNKYFKLIITLGVESIILIAAIIISISNNNKNSKKKIKDKSIKYKNDESSLDNLDKEIENLDNTKKLKKLKKSSKD